MLMLILMLTVVLHSVFGVECWAFVAKAISITITSMSMSMSMSMSWTDGCSDLRPPTSDLCPLSSLLPAPSSPQDEPAVAGLM